MIQFLKDRNRTDRISDFTPRFRNRTDHPAGADFYRSILYCTSTSTNYYLFTAEAAHARLPFARPRRPRSPRLSAVTRAASARSERADIGVHLPGVRLYPRTIAPQHICSHPCAVLVLRNYHRRVLISVAQLFLAAEAATVTELIFWCAYSCQQAATVTTRSCGA